jgi:hypothetical protein
MFWSDAFGGFVGIFKFDKNKFDITGAIVVGGIIGTGKLKNKDKTLFLREITPL